MGMDLRGAAVAGDSAGSEVSSSAGDDKSESFVHIPPRFLSRHPGSVWDTVDWDERHVEIRDADGKVKFSGDGTFPRTWSQNASALVAEKYFRHILQDAGVGTEGLKVRETSVRQMVDRVSSTIARWGVELGYFPAEVSNGHKAQHEIFRNELAYVLLHQMAAFNSPVWFNVGTNGGKRRTEQGSACFINSIEDNMSSILELKSIEGRLYKGGSGSGVNYSRLRSSREGLSGGGFASGPVPFLAADDSNAGAIKSGGTCLAPWQKIYTATGPVAVDELARSGRDFITLSYDPPASRYKAKTARAWKSGHKHVSKITTDKGVFFLTDDHPVRLSSHETARVQNLKPGMSLFACSVDDKAGYVRVHLRDGRKGKEFMHRLIAHDVMGLDLTGKIVHHVDEDKTNNTPQNLQVTTQSLHATLHSRDRVETRTHVFQTQVFDHYGPANGMHADSVFWQDRVRADAYRTGKSRELIDSGRARSMQAAAAQQKMLNTAFTVMNAGYPIDTFEDYVEGRLRVLGAIASKPGLRKKIESRFGTFDSFVAEVRANNHRVVSVESAGFTDVYDVEVDCPTADDKTSESGHNFVLWDGDSRYGSGIVVFNTRRAAKMAILNVDHGDILEFIRCKATSELAAHALIDAGFDGDFRARWGAYGLVPFQNANHSVRVTDAFMTAVKADARWNLLARDGSVLEQVSAKWLWQEICKAAYTCGDPGLQFDDTINRWHTSPISGRINSSNPCSEFMYLDDTACNLASMNLMKFMLPNGDFYVEAFEHAVDVVITAMEIIVDGAGYPTKLMQDNSERYRPLGIGYSNLGAYLMAQGLPYDSNEGRAQAAFLTAILSGRAYAQSAEVTKTVGPFAAYRENSADMMHVMQMHQEAVTKVGHDQDTWFNGGGRPVTHALKKHAINAWSRCVELGKQHGYRNSQISVLAPAGTISFLMDCDTTGIEPDLSLVKYKKLVGGGAITIVNQQVPRALQGLGYVAKTIDEITDYVVQSGSAVGAPGLREEHLSIFDTSLEEPKGGRYIRPEAHIAMMAAVQPFVSGAISKTVNLPRSATEDDIGRLYMLAWEKGLKAVALYRDGCKRTQPLSAKDKGVVKQEVAGEVAGEVSAPVPLQTRKRLPADVMTHRHKFNIAGHEGYIHVGLYADGKPGELFFKMSKEGSTVSGLADTIGVLTSMCLQYGVPLEVLVDKFSWTQFEPSGVTENAEIRIAKSLVDYVFRWLGVQFLQESDPQPIGVEVAPTHKTTGLVCGVCGNPAQRAGSCVSCSTCGATSGCG